VGDGAIVASSSSRQVIKLSPEQAAFLEKLNPCFRERHDVESNRPGSRGALSCRSISEPLTPTHLSEAHSARLVNSCPEYTLT
jgi:hypothetical protein